MRTAIETPRVRLGRVGLILGLTLTLIATMGATAWAQTATVDAGPAPGPITLSTPDVIVPVTITRPSGSPSLMAFSVRFTVSSLLSLPSGRNSITLPAGGGFLNADGGRNVTLQTVDLGGGVYRADGTTLGSPCGSSALSGTVFNIDLTSAASGGTGTVTIDSVVLRDCGNSSIASASGATATVVVDRTAPSVAVTAPNGSEIWIIGATENITWTASDAEGVASVDLEYTTDGSTWNAITTVAGNPGTYAWTIPGPASNTVKVRATAHDVNGNQAADASDADFEMRAANTPPVLAAIGNESVDELATLTFTASATDTDVPTQTLTYSLDGGAPAGASINSSTGAFSWTPTEAQGPGTYPVTVRVTDDGLPAPLDDFEAITITVNEVNVAPTLTGVPASATIPEMVEYTFDADATDADLPAQTLTFSLVSGPAGASIDSGTGEFSWAPTEAQGPGVYDFSVRVSDGVVNTDAPVELTVTEVNTAPVLAAIGNKSVDENVELTFTASATDGDLPAQGLAYSLDAGAPAGATINASTGAFSWTPSESDGGGVFTVTVRVTDDGTPALDDYETITITVNDTNVAPVLTGVPASATIPELVEYTFDADATDSDLPAQTLTFSLLGAPTGASIDGSTGVFTWTPTEAQGPGVYDFSVRVSDGVVNTDAPVELTVTEVNVAPVLTGVPESATIPEMVEYTFDADATDSDLPAQTLTFSLVGAPTGASIDGSTGVFAWTPAEDQGPGTYDFSVRVSDGVVNTDAPIEIIVEEVNTAPTLSDVPSSDTFPELAAYTFTATASDPEAPPQALTFSLIGEPAGAAIGASSGVFSWTPAEDQGPDDYTFTVRVSDGVANTDASITLQVTEVNAAPVLSDVPAAVTIPELVSYTFTATATDSDVPVQSLTFSLVGGPAGATIDGGTGVFEWTPTEAQGPGVYSFSVRVTDAVVNTDSPIEITVEDVELAAVADLASAQVASGNPPGETTGIRLSWTDTPGGTSVEVYRAPFGSYPEYDDAAGAEPAMPASYPPGSPWVLTSVDEPNQVDSPAGRDFYYYIAYVKGAGANISAVSNLTAGSLNYHLGDVSDGSTEGVGNNRVSTEDISALGAHYGLLGAAMTPYNYLDVGPTTTQFVDGRPMTDNEIGFEDLVMFAINYDFVSAAKPVPASTATTNALVLAAPDEVTAGATVTAALSLQCKGDLMALSVKLTWDPAVVEPVGYTAGSWLTDQGGVAFSPSPGAVDAAVLRTTGMGGEGTLATVTFRVLSSGDPKLGFESLDGRDGHNSKVEVSGSVEVAAPAVPAVTRLMPAAPNPFRHTATIAFSLAARGPVELALYSVDGRRVRTLVSGDREPGEYRATWDGRDDGGRALAAGVYYAHLVTAQGRFTKAVAYVK